MVFKMAALGFLKFTFLTVRTVKSLFCTTKPNYIKIGQPLWRNHDFCNFQDGGLGFSKI